MNKYFFMAENYLREYVERVYNASAEDRQAAASKFNEQIANSPWRPQPQNILTIDNNTAHISIVGDLSQDGPRALDLYYGFNGTAYRDILAALDTIEATGGVETIVLDLDTPGGEVTGVDEVFQRIFGLRDKYNIVAVNHGLTLSAGYYIASAAGKIVAVAPTVLNGSIGVRAAWIDSTEFLKNEGFKRIEIVSSGAPNKATDTKTLSKIVLAELNALERVFYRRVAEGRGITDIEFLRENFGQGGILIAQDPAESMPDALSVGMVDEVQSQVPAGANAESSGSVFVGGMAVKAAAGTPAYQDFEIVDIEWDSAAADKRVRRKTGSEDEPSDDYKLAFFWFDPENEKNFGAYKLPFVDVVSGKLVAVKNGVYAANGAMGGARTGKPPDIPAADRKSVQAHIDKYLQKIDKIKKQKQEEEARGMESLAELVAKNPALKTELEEVKQKAVAAGRQQIEDRIAAVSPFIGNASYPASINTLAVAVLAGKKDAAALDGAVAVFDGLQEEKKSKAAAEETAAVGETAGESAVSGVSSNGEILSEADMRSAVGRLRGEAPAEKIDDKKVAKKEEAK